LLAAFAPLGTAPQPLGKKRVVDYVFPGLGVVEHEFAVGQPGEGLAHGGSAAAGAGLEECGGGRLLPAVQRDGGENLELESGEGPYREREMLSLALEEPVEDAGEKGLAERVAGGAFLPERVAYLLYETRRAAGCLGNRLEGFAREIPPAVRERLAKESVEYARSRLKASGYLPYYLYRQKNTVGNAENTGYSLPDKENLYNVIMMEEHSTVFACGAGSITKLVSPSRNDILRHAFPKYPFEYLSDNKDLGFDEAVKFFAQHRKDETD